ncbi:siderophore-interacting protein [Conyzicola nivalis]|uniref:Siderophore-interacting protein n=1 Tax=Conyzicola nivalis TaxID=1477021 RepID=A0A916WM52_9MICO|nr:siderophore-interacting protein [Conyzicola nivalis]GGB11292.1 siderophore-interacting protein [Conyzicola nivalis]
MTTQTPPARAARPQIVLSVVRTEWLAPRMVRVVAGGPGFDDLSASDFTDRYTKLVFVRPELGLEPPYDIPALRDSLPQEHWPVVRTYTIRSVDYESREIAVDFVVHGTEGVAGPWAANARPGDPLVLAGVGGGYSPSPQTGWHVLAGDESAIPAISSAIGALAPNARGIVHIEVEDASDEHQLEAPVGVAVNWIHRGHDRDASLLAAAIDAAEWPDDTVQVFAHGEREAMKAVRAVLAERGVPRERFSLSGYWAYGRTEDRFQAEKREPIGKIAD